MRDLFAIGRGLTAFFVVIALMLAPGTVFAVDASIMNVVDARHFSDADYAKAALQPGPGNNWYVDGTNGNDAWEGRSPDNSTGGLHGPFKTIAKALDRYAGRAYGDRVIIRAGRYHEGVAPANLLGTGSETNRFMIGPYGDGEVIIDASENLTWAVSSGNVYQATLNAGVTADSVVMDDNYKSGRPVASLAAVTADGLWYQSGMTLYLYSSKGTPASRNAMVRRLDENNAVFYVYIADQNYVTLYGLTILSAPSIGIVFYNANNGVVDNCKIKYSGKNAVVFGGQNSVVNKSYIYGNCMMNWPRGSKWGSTGGWPTSVNIGAGGTIRGSIVGEGGGEGVSRYGGTEPVLVEDNVVYNNYSVNIYIDSHPNAVVRRNFVYSSDTVPGDITGMIPGGSTQQTIARRLRPIGIMIGDETAAGGGSANEQIYNNIVMGCRYGISHYSQAAGSGWINDKVYNNVIVLPNADPTAIGDNFFGILAETNANNVGTRIVNNIIIGIDPLGTLVYRGTDGGIYLNNNNYYHPNNATPFAYNAVACNLASWQSQLHQDAGSINTNPLLTGNAWGIQSAPNIADFALSAPSSVSGENLTSLFTTDYGNNMRPATGPWDVGVFVNGTLPVGSGTSGGGTTGGVAPVAPAAPTASGATGTSLTVSWSPVSGATMYDVSRSLDPGMANALDLGSKASGFIDTGLVSATAYYYTVTAVNSYGSSLPSAVGGGATIGVVPAAPAAPVISGATGTGLTVSWSPVSGAVSYSVSRSLNSGMSNASDLGSKASGFIDTALFSGTAYYYTVTAVNSYGNSLSSAVGSGITIGVVPAAPAAPVISNATGTSLIVSWSPVSGAVSYSVSRSLNSGMTNAIDLGSKASGFIDTGLLSGTVYYYTVTAVNTYGSSAPSVTGRGTTLAAVVAPPLAPSAPVISGATSSSLVVSWGAVSGATSYTVRRSMYANMSRATNRGTQKIGFTDTGLHSGDTYYYTVAAVNKSGSSPQSNVGSGATNRSRSR